MILDAHQIDPITNKPLGGVVIDTGTNRRIPLVRKIDYERGTYEAFQQAPNGHDILCTEQMKPIIVTGKAVGQLKLIPMDQAHMFGVEPPKKVHSPIHVLSKEQRLDGLEQCKRMYRQLWRWHGESDNYGLAKFDEYIDKMSVENSFLDSLCVDPAKLKARSSAKSIVTG